MAFKTKVQVLNKPRARSSSRLMVKPSMSADTDLLLTWFKHFDDRLADLTARQYVLLRSLGVEPVQHRQAAERQPSA